VTARRRGIMLTPMETRWDVIVQAAILADELGFEVFSVPEGWGLDSTPILTEIALRTRRIRPVSGVLSVWGRTPATLAMTAATLSQVACGRFVLGLGASTRALTEGFHDRPFKEPADVLRATITRVRALLAGEPALLADGSGARPIRLGQTAVPDLPIWVAALGNRTVQIAAELADGWMPVFVTRERVLATRCKLGELREAAGIRTLPLTVAAGPVAMADEDTESARRTVAAVIAWYLCAMGDIYNRSVASQGYGPEVHAIQAANPNPRPHAGVIPNEAEAVLEQFAAYGRAADVGSQLEAWDSAADIVLITLPAGLAWECLEATLRAASPQC
jgi:alkanesulfonate monooxygenase SsuD/methylene tetrahydromethanopterin reductase-like flavin-dependent oxidoreductase (luciferase family)